MSTYAQTVPALIQMLHNLESWLDEAVAYADARGFDPEILLQARLAPDMFPLTRQIQSACDTAKFIGSRLSGATPPVHEDDETTLAELRARIAATIAFLQTVDASAFDAGCDRVLDLPFMGGETPAMEYLVVFARPNFYFHATCAYALLRASGVKLGKRMFIAAP